MINRPIRIVGTGSSLPKALIPSSEIDRRAAVEPGTTQARLHIETRYFCGEETSSGMAATAAENALNDAGLEALDLDLVISACAVMEQPIPTQGVLVQQKLGLAETGTPVLDVNATCLSFANALDTISYAMTAGRYRRVLIVSSEIASRGLDWNNLDVCGNFGDGAAAVILEVDQEKASGILSSQFRTYSDGARYCELRSGGTLIDAEAEPIRLLSNAKFKMDGTASYKLALKHIPDFISQLLRDSGLDLDDIQLIVPHQASALSLQHLKRMLNFPRERIVDIFSEFGNQISASLPMALHRAIKDNRLKRGDPFMLLGTSAGISLGGLVMKY